jgi:hypothetical protein
MRRFFFITLTAIWVPFLIHAQAEISISNTTKINRTDEVVSVPWNEIVSAWKQIDTAHFIVLNPSTGIQIPYQLEYLGKPQIQNLLLQVTVKGNTWLSLVVTVGTPQKIMPKTYCRYVQERKDDFAWENDKIAFRAYGKALENTDENAFGMDVWVKRTSELILNKRYRLNDYHNDHGDGLDYYHVGLTLGAADIAPFINDSIWYSKNYRQWKILDNGPLRSTFQLVYDSWEVTGTKVSVVKMISIDAGEQLHKISATYSFENLPKIPVAVGIVKRTAPGVEYFNEQKGVTGYWEPTDIKDGTTGVGAVFTEPLKDIQITKGQILSVLEAVSGKPVSYYRGAAWDKAGIITSAAKWFDYLENFRNKIDHPLKIVVRKKM